MQNPMYLPEGTLLQGGKYRIVRFIGAGGFGCTYEAVFVLMGERVAIKEFFPKELCNRDEAGLMSVGADSQMEFADKMKKKFVAEARTLFKLNGMEGVVKVTDVFEENGTSYYVMDYIDGVSLRKLVEEKGVLPEAEAVRLIIEAAQALGRLHQRKCLHLDIKPDNIMLDSDGHPVLIDFGVSKQYSESDGHNSSTLVGYTPGYAPLEQLRGNVRTFLPATDIYALGATLYYLLTGKTPPDASDLLNDIEKLSFPPSVAQSTRRAVEEAMRVKVNDRPKSAEEFLAMLSGRELESDSARNHQASTSPVTRPLDNRPNPRRWAYAAIVGVVLSIIAAVCWRMSSGLSETHDYADTLCVEELCYETGMVYACASEGGELICTVGEWNGFSNTVKSKLDPMGVLLTLNDEQFIIAKTDADGGGKLKWEDKDNYKDCVNVPLIDEISYSKEGAARMDMDGLSNTRRIMQFGKANNIKFPAAQAACGYSVDDIADFGWYLPSAGQLWLMYENFAVINEALKAIGGTPLTYSWSSTEEGATHAWYMYMLGGKLGNTYKSDAYRVRPVADLPRERGAFDWNLLEAADSVK